jgi:vanillate O-demethylase monooxygenase subunit
VPNGESGEELMSTVLGKPEAAARQPTGFVHKLIRDAWYVCAFRSEVGQSLLPRKVLGQPIVLYRTAAGRLVAMRDACPHRFMPLSRGRLYKDGVRCMYHGALYDETGKCIEVPSQHEIPEKCFVKTYPTVEVERWVWIWMGDPAKADPALIPDTKYLGMGTEGFRSVEIPHRVAKARYHLCNENLIDDTHITFLHMGQFESGGRVHTPPETAQIDRWVRTRWFDPKEKISNYFKMEFDVDYDVAPRALVGHFCPPATHCVWIEVYDPQKPDAMPRTLRIAFCFTPETETTTHMFVVESRNYRTQNAEWDTFMSESFHMIQSQDMGAVEGIEAVMQTSYELPEEVSFRADASVMRARRLMHQMLDREGAP